MTDRVQADKPKATEALAEWVEPSSKLDLMTLTTVMMQSGFFPNVQSVSQGVVKILAGRELGFGPVASLRHIYVHRGHIGVMAQLIATKIRQSGYYDYRVQRCDDAACEILILRKFEGQWREEGAASFTIEEARDAGLVKDDSAWDSYPSDLLFARAITRAQKRFCPDVFGQAVYDPSQLKDLREPAENHGGGGGGDFQHLMPQERAPVEPPVITAPAPSETPPPVAAETPPPVAAETPPPVAAETPPPVAAPAAGPVKPRRKSPAPDLKAVVAEPAAAPTPPRPPLGPVHATAPDEGVGQPTLFSPEHVVSFEINGLQYTTAGITKDQMLQTFALAPKADRAMGGKKVAKQILEEEFKVGSRKDLTAEQAERYLIRLQECAGDA